MAFALLPMGMIDHPFYALFLWTLLTNFLFLSAILLLTKRLFRDFNVEDKVHRAFILWGMFLGTARYYLMIIGLGQTDTLIALLLVLFFLSHLDERDIISGVLLGAIIQIKILYLPVLGYFVLRGKWKIVFSAAIVFLSTLMLPAAIVGFSGAIRLLKDWKDILSMSVTSQLLNFKNQSIPYGITVLLRKNAYLKDLFLPEQLIYPLAAGFMATAYAGLLKFRRSFSRQNETEHKYFEISLLVIMTLIFAPTSWEAYYINLILPLALTILFTLRCGNKKLMYVFLGMYFFLSCAIGTDITKYIPGVNSHRFTNISLGAVSLAFAMMYARRRKSL